MASQNRNDTRRGPTDQPLAAERARQGRIVLDTPARRWIFIAGLVGIVVLPLALALFA